MSDPAARPAPGRRRAEVQRSARQRRRFDVTVVLAVLLPLLLVGALLGARALGDDEPSAPTVSAPARVPLPQVVAACPSGPAPALVAQADLGDAPAPGAVTARVLPDGDAADVTVDGLAPATVTGSDGDDGDDGPVVLAAEGGSAPGLLAARFPQPLAAADCRPPVFDQWFTGVGAGADHGSTLEVVNPDAGPAVVEVTVLGRRGEVDAEDLRGVRVPGQSALSIDLSATVPRGSELALHVVTTRGRAVASVLDRQDPLGRGDVAQDYLPSQAAPSTDNLVLAPPAGGGDDTLVLANPGDDETRATIRAVRADAEFAPEGVGDVVLPPGSVVSVPVTDLFGGQGDDEVLGLRVTSGDPTTATVRSVVDGDLAVSVPAERLEAPSATLLPEDAGKRLVVGGAAAPTTVTVTPTGADGQPLDEQTLDLDAGRTASLDLPDEAVAVTIDPRGGPVQAVVALSGGGVAVQRLRPLETTASVPDVRPGPA